MWSSHAVPHVSPRSVAALPTTHRNVGTSNDKHQDFAMTCNRESLLDRVQRLVQASDLHLSISP